jgi:hypothetical protein
MLSDQCNLKIIFQIKKFDLSDLALYSNEQKLFFDCLTQDNHLVINTRINLPTNLRIISKGKNLKLKEFWLGNVKASPHMMNQICSVTYANNKTLFDTCLLIPGTMKIEIYSKSFIEFHLMNKNFFAYE